jgi:hypothetical protein
MNGLRLMGLALVCACGCGTAYNDGLNRGGELSGVVTLDEKPLGGGRVECYSENGKYSAMGNINAEGKYTIKEPPLGACKLVVKTSYLKDSKVTPPKAGKDNPGGSAGMVIPDDVGFKYTAIPAKYEELATTDLTVTLVKGNQPHDIKLVK